MFEEAHYQNDDAAREYLESVRWPEGPVCPHCGCTGNTTKLTLKRRVGVYQCNDCRKQFTVTVGTCFERSHIALHIWVQATYLLCSSKKGMSAHQMHRMLGVTYKTAWFMAHRIREAMSDDNAMLPPMGGGGGIVEVDETYWGYIPGMPKRHAWHHKEKIVSLVERSGEARSFHVETVSHATLMPILRENIAADSRIVTDNANVYDWTSREFAGHESVNHLLHEYARGDVTTNSVEGYFSILKRGLIGTHHHVRRGHLPAYLSEFDFRYNTRTLTDTERTCAALGGIEGKRLFYYN
jgi:transposase-like protein